MKRILRKSTTHLALIAVMLLSVMFLTNCSKDDDNDEVEPTNILVGTKWQDEETTWSMLFGGGKTTFIVLDFSSTTECELYLTQQGNIVKDMGKIKYKVEGNNVVFTKENGTEVVYTIDGRTMKADSEYTVYGFNTKFVKQ